MKKFQYALAAACMLLAVGCKTNEPSKPSDGDKDVNFKQEVVVTSAEYMNDQYGDGNVIATGSNADYSVTLCLKGETFVDGTYSAKCVMGESQVWGFLFGTDGEEDGGGTIYNIDSISATVQNYADEGRIEITAKYYTAAHDSLFVVHFGQKITPVANKTIDITDAAFLDYSKDGGYYVITSTNDNYKDGDFALYFAYYGKGFTGSYGVADFNTYFSSFGYISGEGLEKELTALYGTVEVKEAGTDAYTAVLKLMATDSVFYTINVSGTYTDTSYEIDAEDDIEYVFDPAKTTAQYQYMTQDDYKFARLVLSDGTMCLQVLAFYEKESDKNAVTIVPATGYSIDASYEPGTVAMGFYDANEGIANSFFGTISGEQLTTPIYILTSGWVSLEEEDGKCKLEVTAQNSKKANVSVTYTGTFTEIKNTTSNAPAKNYGAGAKASKGIVAYPNLFVRH